MTEIVVELRTADDAPADDVVEKALAGSTVANSVARGFPVDVRRA